jgi:hypothetical protein
MHVPDARQVARRPVQIGRVNLGCPKKCPGWLCVDRRGEPPWDVYDWLEYILVRGESVGEIRTKNLLEHLPDPGRFFTLCYAVLAYGGKLDLITDNAEFLPFYFPFWARRMGIGAHSINQYAIDHCDSVHYAIFTSMHLRNLMERAGFRAISVRRITMGARLRAIAYK